MFTRLLALLLLVLVSTTLAEDRAKSSRKRHRDPRVHDGRPSDARHDDDDDDDDDNDDDDDDDDRKGGRGGRGKGAHKDDDHDGDHDHDPTYDRESFLGRDDSHRFEELTPKQSQTALLEMLPKIDTNGDGKITMDEMQAYLAAVAKRESRLASDRRFQEIKIFNHALDHNSPMTFDEYKKALHHAVVGSHDDDKKALELFNNQTVRDQARWVKADVNGDKELSRDEFPAFLRPEEAPHMRDIVTQEVMISADKNKDGKIDLNEFMTELHPSYETDVKEKKKLPEWVEKEEKKFKEKLDTNKDGALDPSEIYSYVVPQDYDHSRKETLHLFKIADKDNDKHLTREEILNKWDTFVGYKPEDHGSRLHDEL